MNDLVVDWFLQGDVDVRVQTQRDLLHRHDVHLQERIADEGQGGALLASRHADGHWGNGFYRPKWTPSHYGRWVPIRPYPGLTHVPSPL